MNALRGNVEYFALPDVFRLVARNKSTGALKVLRQSGDGVVYFREGEIYYAFSSLTREFLGQKLVNAKLITQGQLLRILDEQKKSGNRRLGDLLVEKGFISKDLLDTFLREQIQDTIFNLLQWDVGDFEFEMEEAGPQEIGLSVSVENLIMESSRRIEEWEVIQRKIPSLDVFVRMSPTPPEDVMEINIKPEEWTLLVLADGSRTVREIAGAGERSEFEAAKIIYGLVSAGLLDVASAASAAPKPSPARRELQESVTAPAKPERSVSTPQPEAASTVEPQTREDFAPTGEGEPLLEVAVGDGREASSEPHEMTEAGVGNGSLDAGPDSETKKSSEGGVSRDLLLRLIAGVRNL